MDHHYRVTVHSSDPREGVPERIRQRLEVRARHEFGELCDVELEGATLDNVLELLQRGDRMAAAGRLSTLGPFSSRHPEGALAVVDRLAEVLAYPMLEADGGLQPEQLRPPRDGDWPVGRQGW